MAHPLRTAEDDHTLTMEAIRLIARLPAEKRPKALGTQFPHILNRLSLIWGSTAAETYFESLLIDERGGRQGFPFEVLMEIDALAEFHRRTYPTPTVATDPWLQVRGVHRAEPHSPQQA